MEKFSEVKRNKPQRVSPGYKNDNSKIFFMLKDRNSIRWCRTDIVGNFIRKALFIMRKSQSYCYLFNSECAWIFTVYRYQIWCTTSEVIFLKWSEVQEILRRHLWHKCNVPYLPVEISTGEHTMLGILYEKRFNQNRHLIKTDIK